MRESATPGSLCWERLLVLWLPVPVAGRLELPVCHGLRPLAECRHFSPGWFRSRICLSRRHRSETRRCNDAGVLLFITLGPLIVLTLLPSVMASIGPPADLNRDLPPMGSVMLYGSPLILPSCVGNHAVASVPPTSRSPRILVNFTVTAIHIVSVAAGWWGGDEPGVLVNSRSQRNRRCRRHARMDRDRLVAAGRFSGATTSAYC